MSTTVTMVHPTTLMFNRRQSLVESSLPYIGIVLVAHLSYTLVMVLSVFWFLHDTNIKYKKNINHIILQHNEKLLEIVKSVTIDRQTDR